MHPGEIYGNNIRFSLYFFDAPKGWMQPRPSQFDAPKKNPRKISPYFIPRPDARGGLAIDLSKKVHPSSAQVAPIDADLLSEIQAFSMASYQSVKAQMKNNYDKKLYF